MKPHAQAGHRQDAEERGAWITLGSGVALLVLTWLVGGAFAVLANGQGDPGRVWWGITLLYQTIGPIATLGLLGLAGAGVTFNGVRKLIF